MNPVYFICIMLFWYDSGNVVVALTFSAIVGGLVAGMDLMMLLLHLVV